jgi:hypothetical protein
MPNFVIMTDVTKHIAELLFHHDCVIIPGLGGLVANPAPASLNEEQNVFLPPSKEIGFNRNLRHNDGLLINHLLQCDSLTYEQAKEKVDHFVESIQDKLQRKETVSLSPIGELYLNSEKTLVFQPILNENFLASSFGLAPLHAAPVMPVRPKAHSPQRSVARAMRPLSKKQLAASIALTFGLFLFSPDLQTPKLNQAGGLDFLLPTEHHLSVQATATENNLKEDHNAALAAANKEESIPTISEPSYFIIGGSFKRLDQAKTFSSSLTRRNPEHYQPTILNSSNGRFRVAVSSFDNKQEAVNALKAYQRAHGENSAWLLTKK